MFGGTKRVDGQYKRGEDDDDWARTIPIMRIAREDVTTLPYLPILWDTGSFS